MAENIEVSYDILEWFPVLVCQNVFKYLDGKDVAQASVVNKEWNKFCDESPQVEKFNLVFSDKNLHQLTSEGVEFIKNSKRRYQNIEFRNISSQFIDAYDPNPPTRLLTVLEDRAGTWKSVASNGCDKFDRVMWHEILRIIEPSVEKLSISEKHRPAEPNQQGNANWTFPCLKYLECTSGPYGFFTNLSCCTTLVKLHWTFETEIGSELSLFQLLRNNHNLKEIRTSAFGLFFDYPFEFKLQRLQIDEMMADSAEKL